MNAVWDTKQVCLQVPALILHCDLQFCVKCNLPFLHKVTFGQGICHSNRNETRKVYDVYVCKYVWYIHALWCVYVCVHIHVCEYRSVHAKTHMWRSISAFHPVWCRASPLLFIVAHTKLTGPQVSGHSPVSTPHLAVETLSPAFTWVLGIQTQVLTLV